MPAAPKPPHSGPIQGLVTRYRASPTRDKAELRAQMQESVYEYTRLLRERLLPDLRAKHPKASEDELMVLLDEKQPLFVEYDPVVELAIMGADYKNSPELRRQANAEAAQYVRPKLKSIELTVDPSTPEQVERRQQLAGRLRGLLNAAAEARRDETADVPPAPADVQEES